MTRANETAAAVLIFAVGAIALVWLSLYYAHPELVAPIISGVVGLAAGFGLARVTKRPSADE